MFHRILTVTLAAVLAFESPMTAYAARTNPVPAVESAERTSSGTAEVEGNDEIPGNGSISPLTGEADQQPENPDTGDEGTQEPENPDTGDEGSQEPENPDTGEEGSQEPENPDAGEEGSQEPENPDAGEEGSQEPEVPDTEEEGSQEPEVPGTEDEGLQKPEEENPQEPENPDREEMPEEEVPPVNDESEEDTVSGNSVSANTLSEAAFSVLTDEVPALDFDAASKDGVQITLPPSPDEDNYVWYSFTAPKAGRYAFYSQEKFSNPVYFKLYAKPDQEAVLESISYSPPAICTNTGYMEKGETIYLGTYTTKRDGSLTYTLYAAYQTEITKNSDGSYTIALPDEDSVTIQVRTGKWHYQLEVVEPSMWSYRLSPIVCPSDHSKEDAYDTRRDYNLITDRKGRKASFDRLSPGMYDTAFMVTAASSTYPFVMLLTGMDPFVIEGDNSQDYVYVHNVICEKQSISLDLELLLYDRNKLLCQYQPADESETQSSRVVIQNWNTYVFDRLQAGTAYRFSFYDETSNRLVMTLVYSTKEPELTIDAASAEISQDFSTLTVRAKTDYEIQEGSGSMACRMTDSMGREHVIAKGFKSSDKDSNGYYSVDFDTADHGFFLQPGAVYSLQISMAFEMDKVSSARKTITCRAPDKASLDAGNINFQVKQTAADENGSPQVEFTVSVPGLQGTRGVVVFYRAVGSALKYSTSYFALEAGRGAYTASLPIASRGTDYEFILAVGGTTKKVVCSIENDRGVQLRRVKTTTDEVGAFYFVRTYQLTGDKLAGTYYLQAQVYSSLGGYVNSGVKVRLEKENGYQATISSAAIGCVLQPDIEYHVRWLVGNSENVVDNNEYLQAVAYEDLHTTKPKLKLERLDGSHDYQRYQVTLEGRDKAVLEKTGVGVNLSRCIREKGSQNLMESHWDLGLSFFNGYKDTTMYNWLKPDTEYEFSLRDSSGEKVYATDVFRTAKDKRTVTVTETEIYLRDVVVHYALSGFNQYSKDYVICYYRPAGINGVWKSVNGYPATKDGSFSLSGLKINTAYEYVIGIGKEYEAQKYLTNTVRNTVTTKADTRRIEVDVKSKMTSAKIRCQMFNMGVASYNIVRFYYREKGQEQWEQTEKRYSSNEGILTLSPDHLKEDTVYEYRTGFKSHIYNSKDLECVVEGEFRTAADRRTVEIVPTVRSYSATIGYALSSMEGADDGYLLGWFRKASGEGDTAWKKVYTVRTGEKPMEDTFVLGDLEEKTDYELCMGFGTGENTSPDELKRQKTIVFTTMEDGRSLSEAEALVDDVNVTLRVRFSGNVENHVSYLHFFCKAKEEKAWKKAGRVVNLSGVEEETAAVTVNMDDLKKETEYEFAAVLTDDITCGKPEDVTRDAYKAFCSFTTPEAEKPEKLIISQEQLYLNANQIYEGEKGYGYENLKVQWEPLAASSDLVWESSDKAVAAVTADGRVSAVAAGTATITASSAYAPEVSVSCEVTVGHYQIGKKGADGSAFPVEGARLNAARGDSCEGFVLCDTTGQNPVEVSAKVSSGNETVACWVDGVIEIKRAGETRLVFTSKTDQVKAFLTVSVQPAAGKGFAITGFRPYRSAYPAVQEAAKDEAGRDQYTLAYPGGVMYYTALGETMPSRPGFDSGDFNWSIDDTEVATVNEEGKITPHKAGDVLLRVEPKNTDDTALYQMQACEVALHFKNLPATGQGMPYALENTHKKLSDVKLPDGWEGWKWKYPDTPILINGENTEAYLFEVFYEGEQYYPQETSICVQIGRVTGLSAYEADGENHNHVLEVGRVDEDGNPSEGSDSLTMCVEALFGGSIKCDTTRNYTWMEINAPAGVILKEEAKLDYGYRQHYTVTAVKKGNYTLKPVLKVMDPKTKREKILAKTSFKIQAVEEKQAYITITPEETTGVSKDNGRIVINYSGGVKTFRVQAALLDRNEEEEAAFEKVKVSWSVSDKKVAAVKTSGDTHTAEIKVVGEGHTILTAKVKDKAGHTATAQIEIRNLAPRVNVSRVTVNPAYDFESDEGKRLASENGGAVEFVPVYGVVKYVDISLWRKDKKTLETDLELTEYEEGGKYCYLVCPTDWTEEKTYDCYLGVTAPGILAEPFFHPLKVTVKTKTPQVTVKSVRPANLFYRTDPASVDITTTQKGVAIESVRWTDSAEGEDNGFSTVPSAYAFDTVKKGKNAERLYFAQKNIRLKDNKKPAETGIVSGKIKIKYHGYTEAVEKPVSLKWSYKKPAIAVQEKQATLIPALESHAAGSFKLYNNTEKQEFRYTSNGSTGKYDPRICYTELTFRNRDVKKSGDTGYIYTGCKTSGSEKLTMTVVSDYWREPLTAVHTIKFANPTPSLTKAKLVVNTRYVGEAYTDIALKKAFNVSLSCEDIVIEGKNPKSQALLDEDLLEMKQESKGSGRIVVRTNRAQTMRQNAIKNGTYDFKVTPCFRDASGNRIEGRTLTLKIQATDKAPAAKVKLSGGLDLAKRPKLSENCVEIRTTVQNIGDHYIYDNKSGFSLTGEYSEYFTVYYLTSLPGLYRIRVNEKSESKLKAGQRYRLALRYTVKLENGDTFKVQTPAFTVRPKQSVPKVTVYGGGQTLYAGNDGLIRSCGFALPDGVGYRIKAFSGGLDCNRDGKEDITVRWLKNESEDHYAAAELVLTDRDGALTVSGMKGKTYTVPVTITLVGRDGMAKDVKTRIKVTVRR